MQFFTSHPDPYYTGKADTNRARVFTSLPLSSHILSRQHFNSLVHLATKICPSNPSITIPVYYDYLRKFLGLFEATGQHNLQVITCLYFTKMKENRKKKYTACIYIKTCIKQKQSPTQVCDNTEPNVELQKFTEDKKVSAPKKIQI